MVRSTLASGWLRAAAVGGLLAGSLLVMRAVPADERAPTAPAQSAQAAGEPRLLLAQFPGPGFGSGPGSGVGQGSGFGQGSGSGSSVAQQGGTFPRGGVFSLAPEQTVQLTAFCTELSGDAPDAATRFVGGSTGRVALADGGTGTLAQAIQAGIVAIRGRDNSFDPVRRVGSLALDLYLGNTSERPVTVSIPAGAQVTPTGQPAQPLPPGADRLFSLAARKGLTGSNTLQFAVWAARGSTAEEVEQTQMLQLPRSEIEKVQGLLDASEIHAVFDTNRGIHAVRFDEGVEKLGKAGSEIDGSALLLNGTRASVEAVRGPDGKGFVRVKPERRPGEFYYAARFTDRQEGRISVKLFHLTTGRPVRANRGVLLLYPERKA